MKNILEDLNNVQRCAVEATEGPVIVIAGAGSGKTRVLTYRVAHLLNMGIDPFNILALTFTNKASREMKERILQLVGNADAKNVWMGTFHSIFARLLRYDAHRIGYPSNYSIYDTDDSKRLIKAIIKEQNLDIKIYAPNYVLKVISGAKTNLISAQDYNDNFEIQTRDKMAGKPKIGLLYTIYRNRCFKAAAMDFDDLLFNTNVLLRDFPEVLYKYQQKFKYILVDEYQDTNYVQYMIIKKLAANNENICVVGDDAQSIYAFRGANIQNILNFKNDYPDIKEFKLEQNYRSTQTIVNAANSIIINNKNQIFKQIWTQNSTGDLIQLIKANTDNEEGILVANSIFENKMNRQLQNDAFAVLYRTNAQSRSIEEALRKLNIPYRIYGGISFYKRREIKDMLAYYRLTINNKDEDALIRIINYPARGIGKTTIEKITIAANKNKKSLWEIINDISNYQLGINTGTQSRIAAFVTMIKSFSVQLENKNAFELGKLIASSSGIMKDLYEDKTPEGLSRYENIEELLNAIKDFSEKETEPLVAVENSENSIRTLNEFMQDIALLTDADTKDKDSTNKVLLMTIHSAKGLEFPYVYIVGVEENLFPSIQSLGSRADLEEERRLFYVALTRAEQKVTISYAENRYRWGDITISEPSRFIDEIDEKYIEFPQKKSIHNKTVSSVDNSSFLNKKFVSTIDKNKLKKISNLSKTYSANNQYFDTSVIDVLQTGMQVKHLRFGKGKVVSIEGKGSNKKATVFFKNVGQKQLLLKFAKLEIINQ
ncbi:MAG: UvrD-helicase domain-containing protein [Bacteroidales bacterium]|nr:UvrD-helicase domain-containing protein [Bacteroidales bacterium]